MRVALVHDWLTGMRGGERVLDEIAALFPDADLHTLIHEPGATSPRIEALRIRTSPLSRLAAARRHHRALLPLYPWAIRRFRLEGYDLVLSTSHAVAKGVRIAPGVAHLCYCFTPMRYIWDQTESYLGRGLRRAVATPLIGYLRHFDRRTSGPEQVTRFTAVSRTVAARIRNHYGRSARVVYPPVDVSRIRPDGGAPDDFYLLVGGFVPYKREDVVIEGFRRLGGRLVVAGDGPGRRRLAARAPANVTFTGRVPDAALARLYARCRAVVFASEEDFGLVPVEAQAAGRPVIAFARGGAGESVVDPRDADARGRPPTGVTFDSQTPEAVSAAVERFEDLESSFEPRALRRNAERFAPRRFREELMTEVRAALAVSAGVAPEAVAPQGGSTLSESSVIDASVRRFG